MRSQVAQWLATLIFLCFMSSRASADRAMARLLVEEGREIQVSAELEGDLDEALQRFQSAIDSDPDYLPAYRSALPLWLRSGKLGIAQGHLEGLTLRCDDCVFAWYGLGAIYRKQSRFGLAEQAYEVVLAKRPGDADAQYGLAISLTALGKASAASALERYLRLEKRASRARYRDRAQSILTELGGAVVYSEVVATLLSDAAKAGQNKRWAAYIMARTTAYLFSLGTGAPSR